MNPAVQLVSATQQQKLVASVIGFPLEDLFVVYRGVNDEGDFSMDVRVNPLISFVWVGFGPAHGGLPSRCSPARRAVAARSRGRCARCQLAEAEPKERKKASRDALARHRRGRCLGVT